MTPLEHNLQGILDREAARADTHGILLGVASGDGRIVFEGAAGAARPGQPFFMASVTKMLTATVLMQLSDEGRVRLDDPVARHLPGLDLTNIHVRRGVDRSAALTLRHLLHQTSGLPDHYEGGIAQDIAQGRDPGFGLTDMLDHARKQEATALPGGARSHYSDTNFQLLGAVIEATAGEPLAKVFADRIFEPVGMIDGYLMDDPGGIARSAPVPIYFGSRRLDLPRTLASMGADGGGVWTLSDGLRYLHAVFSGALFDPSNLAAMTQWNRLFFPMQYGLGLMRCALPRWMTLGRRTPEFFGHPGASGAFAFHAPAEDLFLVISLNQLDAPRRPFRLLPEAVARIGAHHAPPTPR